MSDTSNTETTFSHSDMIRKVAALLDTAESLAEQGNDEAAATYVQKAHTLQQKYSIDQAMIAERTGTKVEKIISKKIAMPGKWGKQKVSLAHVIANASHCTGYYSRGYNQKVIDFEGNTRTDYDSPKVYYYTCFGFESDVDYVEFLINSLSSQLDSSLRLSYKAKPTWEHGRSFAASFCMGFTNVIGSRLRSAAREAERSTQNEANCYTNPDGSSVSVSLVLVAKKKQVEEEMRAQVGRLGKGTATVANSSSGYNSGVSAGRSATIARGSVSGNSRGILNR